MPLSEGATRARQARRLLQRVLEFAPAGHGPAHRRAHRPPRRGGHRRGRDRGGGGPDHLRLGRRRRVAGGRPKPSSRRPSTRSCATRRATSRWSSSAASKTSGASSRPSAADRTPSWRCASRRPSVAHFDADVDVAPRGPDRPQPGASAPRPSARSPTSCASNARRAGRAAASSRATTSRRRSCARPSRRRLVVDGRRARRRPTRRGRTAPLFGALPETDRAAGRSRRSSWSRRASRPAAPTFDQRAAQAETLEAADRAAEFGPQRAGARRPLVRASRTTTTRSSHDLRPAGRAEGSAGR